MRFKRASIFFSGGDRCSSIDSLLIYAKNLKEKYKIKEKIKYTKYKLEEKENRQIRKLPFF